MQILVRLTLILLCITLKFFGQSSEIETRIDMGELKMTFPSIYFKHNSTEYATMPYTADSCFKFIAANIKHINSRPIWRDSSESEQLTFERIKKLKNDLKKYTTKPFNIQSMKKAQKIAQRTIYNGTDSVQTNYLLSLNSVFDFSGVIKPKQQEYQKHVRIGSALDLASIKHRRQVAKRNKKNQSSK